MLDKLYARIAAKVGSISKSIVRNIAFFENDTGDAIEARLQKIEREIIGINAQIDAQPTDRKSRP
ncbi:hypothetical protein B6S44_03060 [Bosea sp. Tri-44]|uniref:hypothetical protein n=1 Tax=Bosea sp. Tri-44 TaxID=1972137 RepID=UPI00100F2F33|nr:hypothetical protein [Bosea sp. Tri-44]RXT57416.1 hypothetical protein B6S44_03060 [Bosea sp. Tri-44]